MVLGLLPALFGLVITVLLAAAAVMAKALTPPAGAVAAAFGSVIVVVGGFPYLALLILFVSASVLATRYGFEEKQAFNVQEGTHGERGVANVLSHILVPTGLVSLALVAPDFLGSSRLAFLYTSALSFGASDTFASEFGVLSGKARSLLTGRPVRPGTNGGVSVAGELWALVGAFTTALVGAGLFLLFEAPILGVAFSLGGVTLVGFLACQVDSVLGETLENRGWLSKGGTNLAAMMIAVAFAALLLAVSGMA